MNGRKYKFELSEHEVNKVRELIGDRLRREVLSETNNVSNQVDLLILDCYLHYMTKCYKLIDEDKNNAGIDTVYLIINYDLRRNRFGIYEEVISIEGAFKKLEDAQKRVNKFRKNTKDGSYGLWEIVETDLDCLDNKVLSRYVL